MLGKIPTDTSSLILMRHATYFCENFALLSSIDHTHLLTYTCSMLFWLFEFSASFLIFSSKRAKMKYQQTLLCIKTNLSFF